MHTIDIILIAGILGIVAIQSLRGFGKASIEGVALYAALWIAGTFSAQLSHSTNFSLDPAANQAWTFGLSFALLAGVALLLAYFMHRNLDLSMGMFDKLFGAVAGFGVALILAHGLVQALDMSATEKTGPSAVASSEVGHEVLTFSSYHTFIDTLSSETGGNQTVASN